MILKDEIEKLKNYSNLKDEDLNIELRPLMLIDDEMTGKTSIVEILDRLFGKGVKNLYRYNYINTWSSNTN